MRVIDIKKNHRMNATVLRYWFISFYIIHDGIIFFFVVVECVNRSYTFWLHGIGVNSIACISGSFVVFSGNWIKMVDDDR